MIYTAEQAWQIVFAYARRWEIEMSLRFTKSEMAFESSRVQGLGGSSQIPPGCFPRLCFPAFPPCQHGFPLLFYLSSLPYIRKVEPRYLSSTLSSSTCFFSPLARLPPSLSSFLLFGVSHVYPLLNVTNTIGLRLVYS